MRRIVGFYGTLIGKKAAVAVTGLVLFGFVVGHMSGNLKVFLGNDADGTPHIDTYGHFLRTMGEPVFGHGQLLWIARIALLAALVLHVVTVIRLSALNRAARPVGYAVRRSVQTTQSARRMMVSGLLLLAYVVIHILHFTTGSLDPSRFEAGAVYGNLYRAFQGWVFPTIYVVAMALLAIHVYHGVWSAFQTLGLDNPDRNRGLRWLAKLSAALLLVGFSSVPILFYLRGLPPPPLTFPGH